MAVLSTLEHQLLNEAQRDFPLEPQPFRALAKRLGTGEAGVLAAVRGLLDRKVISRLGAVVTPNTAGASTLAAMSVPADRLDEVADIVNAEPGVNHNYEREHAFNLWFVVADSDADAVRGTLDRISDATGLPVIDLPLEKAYHIDLGFPL